jgi:hypothetical protein
MNEPAMHRAQRAAHISAILTGPVPELDRMYALDELRTLFDRAARQALCAEVRLFSDPTTRPRPVAIAECVVGVEGEIAVVAGAVGDTVRQAVDGLIARLRPGFPEPVSRDQHLLRRTG